MKEKLRGRNSKAMLAACIYTACKEGFFLLE
jgi:transcription initiation factor TFIIIB Brf1 subunit/transcription initiation factor TFIIB